METNSFIQSKLVTYNFEFQRGCLLTSLFKNRVLTKLEQVAGVIFKTNVWRCTNN